MPELPIIHGFYLGFFWEGAEETYKFGRNQQHTKMIFIIPAWSVFFLAAGIVGTMRGYPVAGWVAGFLLGPFGLLFIALSKDKRHQPSKEELKVGNRLARAKSLQEKSALSAGLVKCACGEMIPAKERCPFCGEIQL